MGPTLRGWGVCELARAVTLGVEDEAVGRPGARAGCGRFDDGEILGLGDEERGALDGEGAGLLISVSSTT